ncbi:MAG: PHP domain-containing protein [Bacilli bacterium]|nr:PHP domain-containing protein [Bacilli bacterium]
MQNNFQKWIEHDENNRAIQTLNRYYYENVIKPYLESDKIIDLHTHTNFSDGELSPDKLIREAIQNRIGTIAITDHDTIRGIQNLDRESQIILDSGIQIIDGIELTAQPPKGTMHILGLDIDINNKELNDAMTTLKNSSTNRTLSIMEQIKRDYGIIFSHEDIKELINSNHNLGRPDLAKLCIKYGYAESVQDAFNKYLIDAYNKTFTVNKRLSYEECIRLITNANGVPVLAHPKTLELTEEELTILIEQMVECGLKGIEAYHSSHTKEEMQMYLNIAKKYNLLVSVGSDYHGPNVKPNVHLGSGVNDNLNIKEVSLLKHLSK